MVISAERLARNQALYREVNRRIVELVDHGSSRTIDFLCECSSESCTETIPLTLAEFEQVRARTTTFAVVPGHVISTIEDVVGTNPAYVVVEKTEGREAVEAMASRTGVS